MNLSRSISSKEETRTCYKYIFNRHKLSTNSILDCQLASLIFYWLKMTPLTIQIIVFGSVIFAGPPVKRKTKKILLHKARQNRSDFPFAMSYFFIRSMLFVISAMLPDTAFRQGKFIFYASTYNLLLFLLCLGCAVPNFTIKIYITYIFNLFYFFLTTKVISSQFL